MMIEHRTRQLDPKSASKIIAESKAGQPDADGWYLMSVERRFLAGGGEVVTLNESRVKPE